MPYTQETGNNPKNRVFKHFKSPKWNADHVSNCLLLQQERNGFACRSVVSNSFELLYFSEILSDKHSDLSLHTDHLLPSPSAFQASYTLFNPLSIEVVPEAFPTTSLLMPENLIQHSTIPTSTSSPLLLRCLTHTSFQPQHPPISSVEVALKLMVSGKLSGTTSSQLLVLHEDEVFHLLLFKDKQLLFSNSFPQLQSEDILYFMVAVVKDAGLKQDDITVWGPSEIPEIWRDYFHTITPLQEVLPLPQTQGTPAFDIKPYALLFAIATCV
jgi:hypothetical protein